MIYIPQLTFLRFLAASLIVVYHYGSHLEFFELLGLRSLVENAYLSVNFFFFLSGTVLMISYSQRDKLVKRTFLFRRFSRIYPAYLLAFLLALLLGMIINQSYPKGLNIILQLLCVHAWIPKSALSINYPSWSIAVEFFLYFCFPLLLPFFQKFSFKRLSLISLVSWLLGVAICYLLLLHPPIEDATEMNSFYLFFPLWHLTTFLLGMLAGKYILKHRNSKQKLWLHRITYSIAAVLIFLLLNNEHPYHSLMHNGLSAPLFFLLITSLALDRSVLTRLFSRPQLVLTGDISYGIYIYQWPIFILFTAFFPEPFNGWQFLSYFVFLCSFSLLSFKTLESKSKAYLLKKWKKSA